MENIKVSMRYAKAIYPVAKQEGNIINFITDLATIVNAIKQSRELKLLINSPIISPAKKTAIFTEIFNEKVSVLAMNFFHLIISKGRAKFIEGIYNCMNIIYNKENNIIKCQIVSAFELSDDTKKNIEQFLKDTTKGDIIADYIIDNSIIGGFLLRIEDKVYDTTIKNKLKKLKKSLLI